MLRRAGAEAVRYPQPVDRADRSREVSQRQPLDLPPDGEHERQRGVGRVRPGAAPLARALGHPGVQDDGQAGPAAAGHQDDVAPAQLLQRLPGLRPPLPGPVPVGGLLPLGQLLAQRVVLGIVAPVADQLQLVQGGPAAAGLPGDADHRPVRLELGERGLQQGRRLVHPGLADQVHRHVVGRPEAGVQRVGPGAGQARHGQRVHAGLPEHHRVPFDVDAAAAGPPGELGVLPRSQLGVGLAVPLDQPLDHHGPGGHVDPQGQGLGGEHRPDQPGLEQLLDHFLERGQQARVMRGDAALQAGQPLAVAEYRQVRFGNVPGALARPAR